MALKIKVKASEVNNLSDARYYAGMGAEMIGFCMDPNHPAFIEQSKGEAIVNWVAGVAIVLEYDTFSDENFDQVSQIFHPDYIQVSDPHSIKTAASTRLPIILKMDFEGDEIELRWSLQNHKANLYLLESKTLESITDYATLFTELANNYPLILGFGILPRNIAKIVNELQPYGVSLKGGNEIRPGLKSFDEIGEVLEQLEEE